jgi:hypothetical protein
MRNADSHARRAAQSEQEAIMFSEGQSVIVIIGHQLGVIEKVSTWREVNHVPDDDACYFVRVPEWDNGMNGGRWLPESSIALL